MKYLFCSLILVFMASSVMAEDESSETQSSEQIAQEVIKESKAHKFTDQEVGKALESTESTLSRIGRDIAGEIEEE